MLAVTISKEAFDDFLRFMRDNEINGTKYEKLVQLSNGCVVTNTVKSSNIKVGDLILIYTNQRVYIYIIYIYICVCVLNHQ